VIITRSRDPHSRKDAREGGEEDRAVALYNEALTLHRELGNEREPRALGRFAQQQGRMP